MTNNIPEYLPSVGRLLNFSSRVVNALSDKALVPHGLTLAHWIILTALWRKERMTIGELAQYCHATDAVLSRTLDRMADQGLVEREHDPDDRRVVRIHLTPKARELSHLSGFHEEINRIAMKGLSNEERELLVSLLERITANGQAALSGSDGDT